MGLETHGGFAPDPALPAQRAPVGSGGLCFLLSKWGCDGMMRAAQPRAQGTDRAGPLLSLAPLGDLSDSRVRRVRISGPTGLP